MSDLHPAHPPERQPVAEPNSTRPPVVTTRIELPWRTILKVLLVAAILWLLARLWPIVLLLIVAAFLAMALHPFVSWIERRGVGRGVSVLLVTLAFFGALTVLGFIIIPPIIEEGQQLADNLPEYAEQIQDTLETNPTVRDWIQQRADTTSADPMSIFGGVLSVGMGIISTIASLITVFVLTLYLLLEGPRVYRWSAQRFSPRTQAKLARIEPQVSRVMSGYVLGQAATSVLFGIFTYVVLTVTGVPEALLLAVVAALLDAVPLFGAFLATIPAVLLALTVSVPTALVVLALYLVYQQVENYVIVPRVYRGTLQISSLAVLIAVLVGGSLLGIVGVLLALPVAAILPIVVDVWSDDLPYLNLAPKSEEPS